MQTPVTQLLSTHYIFEKLYYMVLLWVEFIFIFTNICCLLM